MRKTHSIDLVIVVTAIVFSVLAYFYIEEEQGRNLYCVSFAGIAVVFSILAWRTRTPKKTKTYPRGKVNELVLLSEENTELASWNLYGKISLVIGRDIGENHVDVNLNHVTYASMIDMEHAVLNYSDGNWYIEDIGSKNGLSIQKIQDGRKYRLSADQPCLLDKGDIIYVGLTRLLIR